MEIIDVDVNFRQFVRIRREQLGKKPGDFDNISESYIRNIELGKNQPLKKDTLRQLYEQLELRKLDKQFDFDWWQAYALLGKNPFLKWKPRSLYDDPLIQKMVYKFELLDESTKFFANDTVDMLYRHMEKWDIEKKRPEADSPPAPKKMLAESGRGKLVVSKQQPKPGRICPTCGSKVEPYQGQSKAYPRCKKCSASLEHFAGRYCLKLEPDADPVFKTSLPLIGGKSGKKCLIYGLVDSKTKEVFYVGQAWSYKTRMNAHAVESGSRKFPYLYERKEEIRQSGDVTFIRLLAVVESKEDADKQESFFVKKHQQTVVNSHYNPLRDQRPPKRGGA